MTLDEIEKVLANYDKKQKVFFESNNWMAVNIQMEYIRHLLPIAKTARELIAKHTDSVYGWTPEPPFVDELNKLHDVLEGLD